MRSRRSATKFAWWRPGRRFTFSIRPSSASRGKTRPRSRPTARSFAIATNGPGTRYHRGDEVLHIEFRKWADLFLVAPLDANTLAKFALGISDNFLSCVFRAWDFAKPVILAPAMNTLMWDSPVTLRHLRQLLEDRAAGRSPRAGHWTNAPGGIRPACAAGSFWSRRKRSDWPAAISASGRWPRSPRSPRWSDSGPKGTMIRDKAKESRSPDRAPTGIVGGSSVSPDPPI